MSPAPRKLSPRATSAAVFAGESVGGDNATGGVACRVVWAEDGSSARAGCTGSGASKVDIGRGTCADCVVAATGEVGSGAGAACCTGCTVAVGRGSFVISLSIDCGSEASAVDEIPPAAPADCLPACSVERDT